MVKIHGLKLKYTVDSEDQVGERNIQYNTIVQFFKIQKTTLFCLLYT